MSLAGLIPRAIALLERSGVAYMLTGSVASTYHGEPRATLDLDIVIDPQAETLERLIDWLDADGFYVDRDTARAALSDRTQFNAIDDDATKIDFMIRKDRPFSREEFGRRRSVDLLGATGFIVSVEDLILAKLEWAAQTDSERQLRDVAGMLAVAGEALERDYLAHWVAILGLDEMWTRVGELGAG